ncbi:MAG: hypothetical protein JWQ03_1473 [Variovorax sp.]|nr:hypothetical protein [Variovorax sp.]
MRPRGKAGCIERGQVDAPALDAQAHVVVGGFVQAGLGPQERLPFGLPGALAGANMPIQKLNSEPGTPASAVVGTSGRAAARRGEPTASGTSWPLRIWPITGAIGEK